MKAITPLLLSLLFMMKMSAYTIVIDPGHGGERVKGVNDGSQHSHGASYNNATARSSHGPVLEKDLALEYSLALKAELEKTPGTNVILTRDRDVSMAAMMRAAIAVQAKADVFLSIHFNGGGATGARAYVVAEDHERWEYMHFANPYIKRDIALSKQLTTALDRVFAGYGGKPSATKVFNDTKYPTKSHGLGNGNLKDGIRSIGYARMDTHLYQAAVVLLEVEFLDNPATVSWLLGPQKATVKQSAVKALAATLHEWKSKGKSYQVSKPLKVPGR